MILSGQVAVNDTLSGVLEQIFADSASKKRMLFIKRISLMRSDIFRNPKLSHLVLALLVIIAPVSPCFRRSHHILVHRCQHVYMRTSKLDDVTMALTTSNSCNTNSFSTHLSCLLTIIPTARSAATRLWKNMYVTLAYTLNLISKPT